MSTAAGATERKVDLRDAMIAAFIKAVEDGVNLAVVVSDSTSTSRIGPFKDKFPERVVDVGIAEQNLVGVAVGLSLGGFVSVTANAAPFLVARANEQVKNDVCYSETNVKLVGLNAGVAYGALASTHHAIDDLSIMLGLGNIRIFAPADAVDAEQIFAHVLRHPGPVYVRMDSVALPVLHGDGYAFVPGAVDVLRPGRDVTIAAVGTVVPEAVAAAADLAARGIDAEVLSFPSLRPLDPAVLLASVRRTGRVLTVEEHSLHGGLGNIVAEAIADEGLAVRIHRLGIPRGQFSKAGPRGEIRAWYGLDRAGIVKAAAGLIAGAGAAGAGAGRGPASGGAAPATGR
jgi:transketolase